MNKLQRLKNALSAAQGLTQDSQTKKKSWKLAHPVSSGLIPIVDYVPPTGHGKGWKATTATTVSAR